MQPIKPFEGAFVAPGKLFDTWLDMPLMSFEDSKTANIALTSAGTNRDQLERFGFDMEKLRGIKLPSFTVGKHMPDKELQHALYCIEKGATRAAHNYNIVAGGLCSFFNFYAAMHRDDPELFTTKSRYWWECVKAFFSDSYPPVSDAAHFGLMTCKSEGSASMRGQYVYVTTYVIHEDEYIRDLIKSGNEFFKKRFRNQPSNQVHKELWSHAVRLIWLDRIIPYLRETLIVR